MAAGVGSKVEYLDYNQIQTIVNNVFGTGSGDSGYGQTVTSSQVAQHSLVSVNQWNSLRNDLLKARQHQSGVDESGNLGLPTLDIKLTDADRAAYLSMATLINNNRTIAPPSGESSFITLITSNRASGWNGTVNQTLTIEFGTANRLRWFFNAGGNFQVSSTLTNFTTTGDSKLVNESWDVLLRNMGIIKLTNSSTTNTGTGTPATSVGFANLTSTNQLIFSKLVEAGNQYTPNQYDLYARILNGSALVLTPTWSYTDAGNDGTYRVFEPVVGTLNSICQMYIATGANVVVAYPQVQFTGAGWTYSSAYAVPPPSYSIRPNVTLINEGATVTYTVSTANLINGTRLYWKNLGSSTESDFTDGVNSGFVDITGNSATITRQVRADLTTEFVNETIILQLLTGSVNGDLAGPPADTVAISDTSLTPVFYTITPSTTVQNEGSPVTFNITTTGVAEGTLVYWINVGTTNSADFATTDNGFVTISGGSASITLTATADFTTEGEETIIIQLRSGSINGQLEVTSATVRVVDASTTPIVPTYSIATSIYSVNEGSSLTFTVTTTNVPDGTPLYWSINNVTTSAGDFATSNGTFNITTTGINGTGSFSVTPTADSTTEGPEKFTVSIRTVTGTVASPEVTSPEITVGDTSTTPPPYVPPPEPPAPDPAPTITMGAITPIGGYGIGQAYSVTYSTSYASAVVGQVTNRGSTTLSTSGTYSWQAGGYGVQTATITATGNGSTSASREFTVYQPYVTSIPQYPKVNQSYQWALYGGLPYGAYSYTGTSDATPVVDSGSGNLSDIGFKTYTSLLDRVQRIQYDVSLIGSGSALYNASATIGVVIHPDEQVSIPSFGGNRVAGQPFDITITQGVPGAVVNYSTTTNSGGPNPNPPGTLTLDSVLGGYVISGVIMPAGNYTFNFTFPTFVGGTSGQTIAQRTKTVTIQFN